MRLILIIVLAAIIVVSAFGIVFWPPLAPFVFHRGGPLGLDGALAANVLAGILLAAVQALMTSAFIWFGFERNQKAKRTQDRADFCRQAISIYISMTALFSSWGNKPATKGTSESANRKIELDNLLRIYRAYLDFEEVDLFGKMWTFYDNCIFMDKYDREEDLFLVTDHFLNRLLRGRNRQAERARLASEFRDCIHNLVERYRVQFPQSLDQSA